MCTREAPAILQLLKYASERLLQNCSNQNSKERRTSTNEPCKTAALIRTSTNDLCKLQHSFVLVRTNHVKLQRSCVLVRTSYVKLQRSCVLVRSNAAKLQCSFVSIQRLVSSFGMIWYLVFLIRISFMPRDILLVNCG